QSTHSFAVSLSDSQACLLLESLGQTDLRPTQGLPTQRAEKYQLGDFLGSGGFGSVYRGVMPADRSQIVGHGFAVGEPIALKFTTHMNPANAETLRWEAIVTHRAKPF